jgi:hypothetical protein
MGFRIYILQQLLKKIKNKHSSVNRVNIHTSENSSQGCGVYTILYAKHSHSTNTILYIPPFRTYHSDSKSSGSMTAIPFNGCG